MIRHAQSLLAAAAAALTISCSRTHTVSLVPVPKFAPNQPVSIWQGDSANPWRQVRIDGGTLYGMPDGAACDSCSAAVPLDEIDSLTVKSGNEWAWALPLGAAAAAMIVWRATDSD